MSIVEFLERGVSGSLQAALVVLLTYWFGRVVRSERIRCRLWSVCTCLLLLIVVAAFALPHPRLIHPWTNVSSNTIATLLEMEEQTGRIVIAVWACGACVALAVFLVRMVCTMRFLKRCQPVAVELLPHEFTPPANVLDGQVSRAGLSHTADGCVPTILSSTEVASPFCWQFQRPYIVIPHDLLSLDDRELQFILRHECEHLRNSHPLWLFVQRLLEVVFWFHPMVWWASQQAALSREFVCDDAAVGESAEVVDYLRTLLKVVERHVPDADDRVVLNFGGGQQMIAFRAQRLVRLAKNPQPASNGTHGRAATAGLIVASVLIAAVWLPLNILASPRSDWSPWPNWTAGALHEFGLDLRDFETYDRRLEPGVLRQLESRPDSRFSSTTSPGNRQE